MNRESQAQIERGRQPRLARLFLNGTDVGSVTIRGHDGSWGFGEFLPSPEFSTFAAIFGRWSLLMHAEGTGERLSRAASEELREAECEIDALRAGLLVDNADVLRQLCQINIDGPLIEWRES